MNLSSNFWVYVNFLSFLCFAFVNFLFFALYSALKYPLKKLLLIAKCAIGQKKIENEVKVLHCSQYFLVVNKPYDMLINSNDPNMKVV